MMTPTGNDNPVVEHDSEHAQREDSDKQHSSPLANQGKRDKDERDHSIIVRDWRSRLQKAFLSDKTLLNPEAMPELDQLFTEIENYSEMTIGLLASSKIGKVMRHISVIPDETVPRDDEFGFRVRAKSLFEKWHELVFGNWPSHTETVGQPAEETEVTEQITQATKGLTYPPAEDNDQRAVMVRDWRTTLQKAFLSGKVPLKPEAMPELDQLFTIVENYSEMTIGLLASSKIGKVMRHISVMPAGSVPRDDEFRFRMRALRLVEKWQELLFANRPSYAGQNLDLNHEDDH